MTVARSSLAALLALPIVSLTSSTLAPRTPAPPTVNVVGLDYAFQMPRELPAGPTVFRFTNRGKVRHELNIFLIKRGVTMDSVLALLRAGTPTHDVSDGPVGVLLARSGDASGGGLYTELLPDREYAVICIFRDTPNAKPHHMLGMFAVIRVLPAPTQAARPQVREPARPIDTIVGMDYAFRYPATLPSGPRAFAFRNDGKVRHEMIVIELKPGVTPDSLMTTMRVGGDPLQLLASNFGLLHVPAGQQALGLLETNLEPGRKYVMLCLFTDSAGAPPHVALGMVGSISVAAR